MSHVSSYRVRYGRFNTNAATGEFYGYGDEPDVYSHVRRRGFLRWEWEITAGPRGQVLDSGTARTKGGAELGAFAASQRPGVLSEWVGGESA